VNKRVVETQAGQAFADKHGMLFLETSAKCSSNVDKAFTEVAHTILKHKKEQGLINSTRFQTRDLQSFMVGQTSDATDNSCSGYCTLL